ncbi:MAG: dihydrodipicolinate synthase family protein, partial [Pseudomonadota bacterium]
MDALQPPRGIFAATPCPLAPGAGIDEARLGAFLAKLARVPGLAGFLLNGHAGENVAMAPADQRRVIEIARAAAPATALVVGVNAESAAVAAAQAAKAEAAGADAIMVFPPNGWALYQEREMVLDHHRAVLEATRCPLFLFQASVAAGRMAYPPETLGALCTLARVIGIKEGSWEVATYEANRRLVHAVAPHIAVMGSGDEHLLTSYVIGSEGSLVSLAAVVP